MTVRILLATCLITGSAAGDWPQWRGPDRDGIVRGVELPADWPEQLEQVWREKVGTGYASPAVAGDAVYTFTREKDDEVVQRRELATGDRVWKSEYEAVSTMDWYGSGNHPKSTPAVAGNRLVTYGITGVLTCWNTEDGSVTWRRTFDDEFETPYPKFGGAASPIVLGETVVVHVGGEKGGALRAFAMADGETVWSWTGDGPGYASPIVVSHDGKQQLITQSEHFLFAVDADTGAELWRLPFETAHDQNVITPVAAADTLYFSGYEAGTHAIRIPPAGKSDPDTIWSQPAISQYMGSPVLAGGMLIGFDHKKKGRLFGLDAATGEVLWLTHGRWGDTASVVAIGDHVSVLSVDGQLSVAPVSRDGFRTAAFYQLAPSETWAHPAFVGDLVIVKDEEHVAAWRMP